MGLQGLDEGSQWDVLSSSLLISFLDAIFERLIQDHVLIDVAYGFSSEVEQCKLWICDMWHVARW